MENLDFYKNKRGYLVDYIQELIEQYKNTNMAIRKAKKDQISIDMPVKMPKEAKKDILKIIASCTELEIPDNFKRDLRTTAKMFSGKSDLKSDIEKLERLYTKYKIKFNN